MQTDRTAPTIEVINYRSLFLMVARDIACAPESAHLRLLVQLLTTIQRAGVDMSEHWDCLAEALVDEITE